MTSAAGPTRVGDLLGEVLRRHGVEKSIRRAGITQIWPEIVGDKLADVTRVKGVDGDALFVEVRNSAWLAELSMLRTEVLERVNARVADAPLARVVFVLAETA
ncbi:MAG: DUF721 domain-containing protein [Gemmatimonadales bacterium]